MPAWFAGGESRVGALDRVVETVHGDSVGARDDHEIGIVAGADCGADLPHERAAIDHGLAVEMAAALRRDLVLVDPGDAARLELADGAGDIELVAVPGVGVGEHWHGDRAREHAGADAAFVKAPSSVEDITAIPRRVNGPCLLNLVPGGKTPMHALGIRCGPADRSGLDGRELLGQRPFPRHPRRLVAHLWMPHRRHVAEAVRGTAIARHERCHEHTRATTNCLNPMAPHRYRLAPASRKNDRASWRNAARLRLLGRP